MPLGLEEVLVACLEKRLRLSSSKMQSNKLLLAFLIATVSVCGLQALDLAPAIGPAVGCPDFNRDVSSSDTRPTTYRDPLLWPPGYYPGDPLPPATIYLTFDDGPTENTPGIIEALEAESVPATFFLNSYAPSTGKPTSPSNRLVRYRNVLLRMLRDGDVIGDHSYSHKDFARLSPSQIFLQLSLFERDLKAALGSEAPTIRLIRPPFGSPWYGTWNSSVERRKVDSAVVGKGFVMLWTIGWDSGDSLDWAVGEKSQRSSVSASAGSKASSTHPQVTYADKLRREFNKVLSKADGKASGIVLMHDTHPTSLDVLRPLIQELRRRGYSFATLEDYCRWRWGASVFGLGR